MFPGVHKSRLYAGNNGVVSKHEMESGLAMQMLVMHNENNHQQPWPGQGVETAANKSKAEKVSRPTIKMGNSEDDFIV